MTPDEQTTWQDVAKVLVTRWMAGPGSKGWEREQVADFIAELQVDVRSPAAAIRGLRAVVSNGFVPSVDQVREAARAAAGPPSSAQIAAATARHLAGRRRHLNAA